MNECLSSPSPCDSNADCVDTTGSYQCTCNVGYSGNGLFCFNCEWVLFLSTCVSLYVSVGASPCGTLSCVSGAKCVFVDRGYQCECPIGMLGNGRTDGTGCHVPQNGCDTLSPCSAHATCSVAGDNFVCQCKAGYNGDGYETGSGCKGEY